MATVLAKRPCEEATALAQPDVSPCAPDVGIWVLVATILGSALAFIDGTVVNVALPVIQTEFGASAADAQWIVQAAALFLGSLILVGGSLGDHYGRRRIFVIGIIVFGLASIGSGLAQSITQLIIARAVQGIGAAMLVPNSLAVIAANFSANERGRAIGTWSGFTGITTALGPVLGGWLVDNVSWRAVFFINVPIALAALAITLWRVPESRDEEASSNLDFAGAILATVGLGAVVFSFTASQNRGLFDPVVIGTLIAGVVMLVIFVMVEARITGPMMPLKLFASPTFSGANLLTLFLYAALGGMLYFLPFNLIQVQGYSPSEAGAALLPFILIMFFMSRWSGGLVERYGAKLPLVIGPSIVAVGFLLFALPGIGGLYWVTFFPAIVVLGFGMSLSVPPLTTTVMNAVDSHQAGTASGINNAASRVASLLGIAIFGIFMASTFNVSLDAQLADITTTAETQQVIDAQRENLAGAQIAIADADARQQIEQAFDRAYVSGFRVVMFIAAALALISAATAWVMIEGKLSDSSEAVLK